MKLETFFDNKEEKEKTGEARLAMTLEPLAQALGCPIPYPKPFPVDTDALDKAYGRPSIKKALESLDAPAPSARKVAKERSGAAKSSNRTPAMQKERSRLQASMQAIAANPADVMPYADPTDDRDFQQSRMKTLRQHSQRKVLGENVTLP